MELSEGDSSRVVELSPGESVVVRLESNPSTGYEWGAELSDSSVLSLSGQTFETESELAGSPGVEVFTFQAESAGRSTISLAYRRPWETDVEPEETVSFEVVVDE